MLQTTLGARLTLKGDDQSKMMVLDLRNTVFQIGDSFGFLPKLPDSVLRVNAGGPNANPEDKNEVKFALHAYALAVEFNSPLLSGPDDYTIEMVFGYNTINSVTPEEPDGTAESGNID